MDSQLAAALAGLAIAAISALGVVVKVVTAGLEKKLDQNTAITAKVEKQTNGELAKARDQAQRLTWERDALRDMVRYVNSTPEGRKILLEYADRRRVRVADAELDALIPSMPPQANP